MAHKTKRAPFQTEVIKERLQYMRSAVADERDAVEKHMYIQQRRAELIAMINENADHWLREIDRIHPGWSKGSFRDSFKL